MRKMLKVMSVLIIIFAVLTIVISAVSLAGGSFLSSVGLNVPTTTEEEESIATLSVGMGALAIILGVVALLEGIFNLLTGIMGYRGAKGEPRCAGKAKVMGIISLVVVLAMNIYSLCTNLSVTSVCSAITGVGLQVLFVYYAYKIQHEEATPLNK